MNILSVPSVAALGAIALTVACGGATSPAPVEIRQRFAAPTLPAIDLRLRIQPEHAPAQERYVRAAMATLKSHGQWLGPLPDTALTIVDPPWRGSPGAIGRDTVVLDRAPWWSTTTSMAPELAAARAISRRFFTTLVDMQAMPPWFVEGLVELAARRVVAGLFEQENLPPGYGLVEQRYFDSFVPLRLRTRLLPETSIHGTPALNARAMLALGTLERWVGRPAFDQLIAVFVVKFRSGRPTVADFARTAADVTGQDLSWLFDEAIGSSRVFDYGVSAMTSERGQDGAFDTMVVARRFGDARFTGTSAAPIGPFESGHGVTLRVLFDDGRQRTDYWDGRSGEKTFRYRSPARAASAVVDPDRALLLDVAQTNNSMTLTPRAGAAASIWAARWMAWLEHALLNYSALV